ncbi:TssQ family T6SS-associated lipoprotein [Aquabacterium sp. A7-Y]|uniref:TssQ family T6SS-associated lipoprotein n=1 Tax=Aquabacterium sp. A7-Y TaxID=1349605 RepID=UPI00223E357B|nr:TssQ family T6SS-associated lipoprotein [Aquabacterium sp. A7-Y]MCW7539164.1 TssQ family T6SS-associated lipoprotein [Aquabacterium sp. A7-Y]
MRQLLVFGALCALLAGCAELVPQPAQPAPTAAPAAPGAPAPAPAPAPGVSDLLARPAERALLYGMRAYDDAQYPEAERQLNRALQAGLASPRDRAAAHKYLAFIYCTSQRTALCEAAFRAARRADAGFALSKSEAGHPLWGPVFVRSQR